MPIITKPEKIARLKALGVQVTGKELVAELDAMLAKYERPADDSRNSPAPVDETGNTLPEVDAAQGVQNAKQKENAEADSRTEVIVRYINPELGLTDRTFSYDVHGEDFIVLAEQFAAKYDGTIDPV